MVSSTKADSERSPRPYRMGTREKAAQVTREAILDAAEKAFANRWFDEVTLKDVARAAGVAQQTVVNHFGSKENLYLTGIAERFAPRLLEARSRVKIGDVRSLAEVAVADYEQTGIATLRVLALADRHPALAQLVDGGRRSHHDWVATVLAPLLADRPTAERTQLVRLVAATVDVRTWHQLRHERTPDDVVDDLETMVTALLRA